MLYLVRSSRFREYQQQNLHLLSADPSTRIELRYSRQWVDPALAELDLTQQPVVIVLSDAPHERPAPVRLGRVLAVQDEQERIELQILLLGHPRSDLDRAGFARWFVDRQAEHERQDFVFLDEPGFPVPEEVGLDGRAGAFRAAVDGLLASDSAGHYQSSVFLLDVGMRRAQSGEAIERTALITGRTYQQDLICYCPQLAPGELTRRSLGLSYDRTELELLDQPGPVPADGRVNLHLRVLVPGTAGLQVYLRPNSARSTRLELTCRAVGDVLARQAACQEGASEATREELRGLLQLLRKHGALADAALERGVLERLLSLAPEDPEILRQKAWHHHRVDEHAEAEQIFAELGPGHLAPEDWLPYFLSACRCNCSADSLTDIVSSLPWDRLAPEQARQIGQCLAGLPERAILGLLESLAYFGTERFLQDIWQELRPAIRTPDGIWQTYKLMRETHLDSALALYHYLSERLADEGILEARFDALLVENGLLLDSAPSGFAEPVLRHLKRLVDAAQHDEALVVLEQVRPLMSPAAFDQVRIELAGGLAEALEPAGLTLSGRLFADAAEASRVRGDLDEATIWLERSALVDPQGQRLVEVQAGIERAVDASEHVQLLTEALFAQRIKLLRDKLAGSKLTIVGGPHEKPWVDALRQELAVSEVVWFISDMGKRPRADKLKEALGKSVGAVAVLTYHVGHRAAEVVREEARKRDIPCAPVFSGTSKNALLQALIKAVLE